jgi:hypothetical protein
MKTFKRRLVSLGIAVVVVGGFLYVVLAFRDETKQMLPRELPYPVLQYGLLALLVVLVLGIVQNMRRMGGDE